MLSNQNNATTIFFLDRRKENKGIDMAPHDLRRPFKRPAFSDQQRRRDASLRRQDENREDARRRARSLLSTVLSFQGEPGSPSQDPELQLLGDEIEDETEHSPSTEFFDVRQASKLRGREARLLFAKQLMLPEWMIDVPDNLSTDWLAFYFHSALIFLLLRLKLLQILIPSL